ncbi:hypothetical protein LTR97_011617 [Elasticomyces elasticus]|uniref:Gfd2/YDR514C-like C-terminal domain-containing protein n=1 Tax=Elasticomyces elasticus TaxID=574655 RepID=A0AAN7ZYN9_9PEZI|nr:hypothetical protein LTR97_011617 [Elasticomyces elasticus]
MNLKEWRQLWFDGPEKEYLWRKYNDNRKVYFAAYYKDNDTILSNIERGMETFVRWEKKLLNIDLETQARKERRLSAGRVAMKAFVEALATNTMTVEADFVILSIDFEGDIKYGVKEFGFAKLDTRDVIGNALTPSPEMITGHNYALSDERMHGFMFGKTSKTDEVELATVIRDVLHVPDEQSNEYSTSTERRLVLVGHALQNELRILDGNGVDVANLHTVLGTMDTCNSFGRGTTLKNLLASLHVPLPLNRYSKVVSLHNAGNDAHYTLRALLALLHERSQHEHSAAGQIEILHDLAMAPLPVWPPVRDPRVRQAQEDDEEGFLNMAVLHD